MGPLLAKENQGLYDTKFEMDQNAFIAETMAWQITSSIRLPEEETPDGENIIFGWTSPMVSALLVEKTNVRKGRKAGTRGDG